MTLQDSDADPPARLGLRNVSISAFALNEFFDVLDELYLERNGITTVVQTNDSPIGRDETPMEKIRVGDRVYHFRKGDPTATEGYGTVLEIGWTQATLVWEHNGRQGRVERRDLLTEREAREAGF